MVTRAKFLITEQEDENFKSVKPPDLLHNFQNSLVFGLNITYMFIYFH